MHLIEDSCFVHLDTLKDDTLNERSGVVDSVNLTHFQNGISNSVIVYLSTSHKICT